MSQEDRFPSLQAKLEALASQPWSQTRAVARELPAIERALASGARLVDIHTAMCQHGLKLSFPTFKNALRRCRKSARNTPPERPALPAAKPGESETNAAPALPAKAQTPPATSAPSAPVVTSLRRDQFVPAEMVVARQAMAQMRAEGILPPAKPFIED